MVMPDVIEQMREASKTNYYSWITIWNALSLSAINNMLKLIELNVTLNHASSVDYTNHQQQNLGREKSSETPHYDSIK